MNESSGHMHWAEIALRCNIDFPQMHRMFRQQRLAHHRHAVVLTDLNSGL